MLEKDNVTDCLKLLSSVSFNKPPVTELMVDFYHEEIEGLSTEVFEKIVKVFYNLKQFPTIADFTEFGTKANLEADWFAIVAVANGTQKSAEISGISEAAIVKVTSSHTSLGALRVLIEANEFQTNQIRKDWLKMVVIPANPNALPPAKVTIQLAAEVVREPSTGYQWSDYQAMGKGMMEAIKDKGSVSAAWLPIIDRYPPEIKREVYKFIDINGCKNADRSTGKFDKYRAIASNLIATSNH